ncbi:MAG: hypothetical protein JO202_02260 [Ktedonobacteraceae bacterium]|nr:hypothetical protein [Ktedonobacteraceae bacterium]
MYKKVVTSLALLLFILCSCAAGAGSSTTGASPTRAAPSASQLTENATAAFSVTSVDMTVSPTTTSTWTCGSYIQVVYNATFHVVSGPSGGVIVFSYTLNNGRSETPEKLTILPGQHLSNYVFTWQGALPSDHTYPGRGGVMVTSPNQLTSPTVSPAGACR